jgi:hypothetical protein
VAKGLLFERRVPLASRLGEASRCRWVVAQRCSISSVDASVDASTSLLVLRRICAVRGGNTRGLFFFAEATMSSAWCCLIGREQVGWCRRGEQSGGLRGGAGGIIFSV